MKAAALALMLTGLLYGAKASPEAEAYFTFGSFFVQSGDYENALPHLLEAVAKDPDHALAWFQIGTCRSKLGQWKEAISAYERAVKISPGFLEAQRSADLVAAMHSDDPGDWCRTSAVNLVLLGIKIMAPGRMILLGQSR